MSNEVIIAEVREAVGKEYNKKIRRAGSIPAIYYSSSDKPVNLQINTLEFNKVLNTGNKIIDLKVKKKSLKVLIRDVQFHPVSESILHVDFQGVKLTEIVNINVPIKFVGNTLGVKEGGILEPLLHDIEIACKVSDIPHEITIDTTELNVGDGIHVRDLNYSDFEILTPEDSMIVMVGIPAGVGTGSEEDEEAEGEEEEGSETESGEE